ncbi:hypothetical protein BU14_0589s0003 [Porphyra umbilicalis]|uniref:FLZ-type domain-containing protein n=1 Tax=Porphyra umbilicalis TaxID=2786 RepID=A0A1X6NRA6_PORUM|nr:hypothetical protein BU14_0589s0003 [Porphyra umbilicalis]|eukprot:OSX71128.1 hypothetical protein BU14_0589s0003 [Porphyra umbilicalis]
MQHLQLYPPVAYDVGRMPTGAALPPRGGVGSFPRLGVTAPTTLTRRHSHWELGPTAAAAVGGGGGGGAGGVGARPSPPPASPCHSPSSLPEGGGRAVGGSPTGWAPRRARAASASAAAAAAAGGRGGRAPGRVGSGASKAAAAATRSAAGGGAPVAAAPSPRSVTGAGGAGGPRCPLTAAVGGAGGGGGGGVAGHPPRHDVPGPASAVAVSGRCCDNCGREHLRLADAVEDCVFRQLFCSIECYWSERFRREEAGKPRCGRH